MSYHSGSLRVMLASVSPTRPTGINFITRYWYIDMFEQSTISMRSRTLEIRYRMETLTLISPTANRPLVGAVPGLDPTAEGVPGGRSSVDSDVP